MSQRIAVSKEVAVFGDTLEGKRAVEELLGLGFMVHWVALAGGGHAALLEHPRLSLHGGIPSRIANHVGGFEIAWGHDGDGPVVRASALVVATGNAKVSPLPAKGVPSSSRVVGLTELRAKLDAPRETGAAAAHRNLRVLIALDLVGITGQEMAAEAFDLACRARREWHSEVFVLYRDLGVDAPGLEAGTRRMREQGVVFCRYGKASIAAADERVTVDYGEGVVTGDLLAIPETVQPREDTAALAALLGLPVGGDGWMQDVNVHQVRPGMTARRGVFVAGRCHADLSPADAEADAVLAAANVDALLSSGWLAPDDVVAEVDAHKCVRCLTCVRTCLHKAVEIVTRDGVTAARVAELACHGCGACVSNCPMQAISLDGHAWPAWMQAAS